VIWKWESDPFGAAPANDDPDGDSVKFAYNLRFPGQYFDAETGLHQNYHRDYNPPTGGYIESDPIGLRGGMNPFAYVGGNPIRFVDNDGQMAQEVVVGGLIATTGLIVGYAVLTPAQREAMVTSALNAINELTGPKYDAPPLVGPTVDEMAKGGKSQGRNWATEAAKSTGQIKGMDPCDVIAEWLEEAKAAGDKKTVQDLIEAEKFMDCRNKNKRKNKYRCE
jgi:RHS repeat-associated protein